MSGRVLIIVAAVAAAFGFAATSFATYVVVSDRHDAAVETARPYTPIVDRGLGIPAAPISRVTPAPPINAPSGGDRSTASETQPTPVPDDILSEDFRKLGIDDPVTPQDESASSCADAVVTVQADPLPRACIDFRP